MSTKVLNQASGADWTIYHADNIDVLRGLPDESIHFSLFSPPYSNLYCYSSSERDMGNARDVDDFFQHFGFLITELLRVIKPGRIVGVDCTNLPLMKERDGYIGLYDFRGELIRHFVGAGFIYHSEHCIWKDPLIEATRTKSLGLMHKQLIKDSAMSRAGLPAYLLAFRKPGENAERVIHASGVEYFIGTDEPTGGVKSHEYWRRYASPIWDDVDFSKTLNAQAARDGKDERHICPMSLDIIERAMWLWSNPGDVVLDPFNGVGSTGYVAIQQGRKYIGAELKDSYFRQAVLNLKAVEHAATQEGLFATVRE